MRFRILLPIVLFPWLILQAQDVELPDILIENPQQHEERMSWWNDAKFGALITWGVFSTPGKGEWVMWNEQIPVEEYARLADEFNPDPDAMEQWASVAGEAGMKYLVLTTRFCDGFALWPSQSSWRDFTIRKTPARFDPVEKYVAACRNHDLGVGFYYSPGDWRMPGFWFPGLYYDNAEIMKEQGYGQVKELLTEYGKIDIMWWDVGGDESLAMGHAPHEFEIINRLAKRPPDIKYPGPPLWEENKLNAMVRNLQPDIIINNRNQVPGAEWKGDFKTPECRIGEFNTSNDWETCDFSLTQDNKLSSDSAYFKTPKSNKTFWGDTLTHLSSISTQPINIFPNPTNGELKIKLGSQVAIKNHISIYDLYGRHLLNRQTELSEMNIDLSYFEQGVYLIRINDQKARKIILTRN